MSDGKTKALFLDLDGTLLTDQKKITEGNYDAIHQALGEGHKIVITTGRPLVSAIGQAERLELTDPGCYLIAYNGGVLYDMGERRVIDKRTLDLETVCAVFSEASRRNIHIQTYSDRKVLVEPGNDDEEVRKYCSLILMQYEVLDEIHHLRERPVKMLAIDFRKTGKMDGLQDWISRNFGDRLDSFYSSDFYLEIVPKGMNKGNAVRKMADLLHIPMEATVAAGDAPNDIPMIRAAHTGVCMANGDEEVKRSADYVTERDNNHDGVAEIIRKFLIPSGSAESRL